MSKSSDCCSGVGKVIAYGAYVSGLSVAVGIVRLAISVAHIAKHIFYAEIYPQAEAAMKQQLDAQNETRSRERDRENEAAERNTRRAKGFVGTGLAMAKEGLTKASNAVEDIVDGLETEVRKAVVEVATPVLVQNEQKLREEWEGQAVRGLVEIVPIVGALYYTYRDYMDERSRDIKIKPGTLGLNHIIERLDIESQYDANIRNYVNTYNPWF